MNENGEGNTNVGSGNGSATTGSAGNDSNSTVSANDMNSANVPASMTVPMPMPNNSGMNNHKNTIVIECQPKRRVSIAADAVDGKYTAAGYDNPAFDQGPRRKISQTSMHSHTDGPARRRSILTNPATENESDLGSMHSFDNRPYRMSALDALNEKIHHSAIDNDNIVQESWIYAFCLKCRGQDNAPAWEPPHWQKICPFPLCPTYRQFARIIVLILIGILVWTVSYFIIGKAAAPGGQLFGLVVLTVAANFGGYLISLTTLPRLIGMLLVGILFQNLGWVDLDGDISKVCAHLRKFALAFILIRAGLEMDPEAFKKMYKTILKLGIIPLVTEGMLICVFTHFLLDLPWIWAALLGSIISAVAPAVVVPVLFRLRIKGYGVAKGIPTVVVSVSGIDDAMSVALFGIISSIMFSDKGLAYQISQAPVCIIGGLLFGYLWGNFSRIFPEKNDAYVVPLRTLMLFTGCLVVIYGSEKLGYEGAGPLGVVFAAFVSNMYWCQQGWELGEHPVSTAFEIIWMIFEPILFGMTGATIKFNELDSDLVLYGGGSIAVAAILRVLLTGLIAFGDGFNVKERIFVAFSWMAKATVQAALGPVALKSIGPNATKDEENYAKIVQTIAIISIIFTAPLGAIILSVTGTKLLTKTKQPPITDGWRRSHRPSIRDISIIDEEEEREDPESPADKATIDNTQTNANLTNVNYVYTNKL